jgi:hypothetical protein
MVRRDWNATQSGLVRFEPYDERPKDGEVWNRLLESFRAPESGDPRRPQTVRVARKTWQRAWASKLAEIGVECQLCERLEELERSLAKVEGMLPGIGKMLGEESAADRDWSQFATLPQFAEATWQADVRQLPAWVQIGDELSRPWVCLVVDAESNAILSTDIVTHAPTKDWLLRGVWQALSSPAIGEPHRPGRIEVATEQARAMLAPALEPAGVDCVADPNLEFVRILVGELTDQIAGKSRRQALIDSPGVSLAQLGSFFAAAADFYRSRPWRCVPSDTVIRIECNRYRSGPWYGVVMGQSGMELGMTLYEDLKVLNTILQGKMSDRESARRTSTLSVTYGEPFDVAPLDVDAAEEHGWPIAGPEAYPCVMRVKPGLAMCGPLQWELELLEGCLRAIPGFLDQQVNKAAVPVTLARDTLILKLERLGNE